MTFNPNARLDTSEVEDQRGGGGGGGSLLGGLPGGGLAAGGGGIGLVVTIIIVLFNVLQGGGRSASIGGLSNLNNQSTYGQAPAGSALAQECLSGADANSKEDCRIVAYIDSVQTYWTSAFAQQGHNYAPAKTVFFTGQTQTGCGAASTEVGPFYCPVDKLVYIDLGFFQELQTKFGAQGGSLAQGYVIAHEYGHHIQDLLGLLTGNSSQQGTEGQSVRTELQADCFAGIWAHNASATGYLEPLTDQNIADALNAAGAVGDDRLQQKFQGKITPETWTHGSSAQRQHWFTVGYQTGDQGSCDTFHGTI